MTYNHRSKSLLLPFLILISCLFQFQPVQSLTLQESITDCEVLIIGGTTAALGAALASASYVKTCLTEPTDWVGGQLTSEGLPAIDFAWHKVIDPKTLKVVDVASINLNLVNRNPLFTRILENARQGVSNPGKCWVSRVCTTPVAMMEAIEQEVAAKAENLTVYLNTVPKSVQLDSTGRKIINVEVIQRTSKGKTKEFTFMSEEFEDWYSRDSSEQYTKQVINFSGFKFVSDTTSFGDLMVLAKASYLQGIDEQFDGDVSGNGNDTCGQSFTFDFAEKFYANEAEDVPVPNPPNSPFINDTWFKHDGYIWQEVVTYRRVHAALDESSKFTVKADDITVENWGQGNDQKWIYLFLNKQNAKAQIADWKGGINKDSLIMAEALAVAYHRWFRAHAPAEWANRTVISPETMNTTTGLAKMPYLRDTRRSIGINDFVVTVQNLSGTAEQVVGTIFEDRVGLGAYNADIHGQQGCVFPAYMKAHYDVLPYYIPFRALTNRDIDNMLVAGKTMAMSFLANAAIRLHPEEFTSGQAAGAAMAFAVQNGISTAQGIYERIGDLQKVVKQITPLSWTINGTLYPPQ